MNVILNKLFIPEKIEYLLLNQDLIILETSSAVRRFADCPDEVMPGKDVRLGFPELVGVEDILVAVLQGQQDNFNLKGIARSSEPRSPLYIDLYVESLAGNLIVLFEDVTEIMVLKQSLVQRASEAEMLLSALTVSQDYLNKIILSIGDALFITAASGKIKTVNKAAEFLLGYSEAELIGKPISLIIASDNFSRQAIQQQVLAAEVKLLNNVELACRNKTGEEIAVEFCCSAIQTEIKGLFDFVYIGRDITERKRAEAETRKALEKEKELGELKSRFVSMTSHEFRNPLNSILMSIELLENYGDSLSEAEKKNYLKSAKNAAHNMIDLLEDILVVGKAEAGKLEFKPVPLNPENFCADLVREVELIAREQRITFVSRGPCNQACMDEKLLRQILANLLSNALKYSPQGETVHLELRCRPDEGTAIFEIRDRGIGIPPEDQQHLFESFHRAKNVGKISGTGLGLSIVKKAVDLHGGRIAVDSEVGVGTTFTIILPLNSDQLPESDQ